MRYAPNYFRRQQLSAMFCLFPDPHFKRSNHRRRLLSDNCLAVYAYCLRPGGRLYICTDVRELFEWMLQRLTAHPLFARLSEQEMADDPCVSVMQTATEEGQKVSRLSGSKYPAVFRRLEGRRID